MADSSDFDGIVVFQIEEEAIVAASETKACERGLQLFHISGMVGEVAIQAIENSHGLLAVDGAEIAAGLGRPDDRQSHWRRLFSRLLIQAELAPDFFVRDAFTASK